MTATEALERRIDELCCENEQLRQENQSIGMAAYELGRASLADENAKLRELVRTMAYCMQYERDCDGCRLNGADGAVMEPARCDGMRDRMCELGIEVEP